MSTKNIRRHLKQCFRQHFWQFWILLSCIIALGDIPYLFGGSILEKPAVSEGAEECHSDIPSSPPAQVREKVRKSRLSSSLRIEALGPFVFVPPATYQRKVIKTVQEKPQEKQMIRTHPYEITLDSYEILETAISQETYAKVMNQNPSLFKEKRHCPDSFKSLDLGQPDPVAVCSDLPVENVSWNDATRFLKRLSRIVGSNHVYALPTAAQLEYALMERKNRSRLHLIRKESEHHPWGRRQTHPLRSRRKTPAGIYQSSVWEWVSDWYGELPECDTRNPSGPGSGLDRVLLGRSWLSRDELYEPIQRSFGDPSLATDDIGFRIVRSPFIGKKPSFKRKEK